VGLLAVYCSTFGISTPLPLVCFQSFWVGDAVCLEQMHDIKVSQVGSNFRLDVCGNGIAPVLGIMEVTIKEVKSQTRKQENELK
jgi:hypothetical protein